MNFSNKTLWGHFNSAVLLIAVLATVTAVSSKVDASDTIRVLHLGDSITQGSDRLPSYRYPFYKRLVDGNYKFELVGSQDNNFFGNPSLSNYRDVPYTNRNEGHWGWRTDQIRDSLPTWLLSYTPDVVFLLIGSNDIGNQESVSQILGEMDQIIELLRADNPKVIIFLSNLTPATGDRRQGHIDLGRAIPTLVSSKTTSASPVLFVDVFNGFSESWLPDGLHPNSEGDDFIAARFYAAFTKYFRP